MLDFFPCGAINGVQFLPILTANLHTCSIQFSHFSLVIVMSYCHSSVVSDLTWLLCVVTTYRNLLDALTAYINYMLVLVQDTKRVGGRKAKAFQPRTCECPICKSAKEI